MFGMDMNGFLKSKMNLLLILLNLLYIVTGLYFIIKGFLHPSLGLGFVMSLIVDIGLFSFLYILFALMTKNKLASKCQKQVYWINNSIFIFVSIGYIGFILSL